MRSYEWDREVYDEHGDIIDHYFADKLKDVPTHDDCMEIIGAVDTKLTLVLSEGNESEGLQFRAWAYVEDWALPENFSLPGPDGYERCGYRVPQRFHKEVAK